MTEGASRAEFLRWRFGEVELDESNLSLTVAGVAVVTEPRPIELLMVLLRRGGEVCTKAELLEELWPGRIVTEGSLSNCVAKLRLALADREQTIIRTVHGYGYRLGVPVKVEAIEALAPASTLQLEPGIAVPRRSGWTLSEKLGVGGAGEVWLARSKTSERRVFKFSQNADLLASLKREVTLSRLIQDGLGERPDFVRVLDWNFDEPPYYLETEYCPAGNLGQWLERQAPLPAPEDRLDWVAQAAEALASAHALGVLHKDLKPSNLLVEEIGDGRIRIKLGDWGSGHVLDLDRLRAARITRLGFTQAGSDGAGGTPVYQAPEVAAGQPATIQADIYSLGVLLYQLAVGDLRKPLAPGWERDIDDELLRQDIAQAADGDPAKRLSDATELARRIRNLASRRAHSAAEHSERQRVAEQKRVVEQWRARRMWVVASGLLLVSGLVVSLFLYRRAEANAADAREQAQSAEATENFLLNIFFADDRSKAQDRPVQELSAKSLLDGNIDRIATTLAQQPAIQLKLLKAARKIYTQWNDKDRWLPVATRIVDLSEQLYGSGDPRTLDEMLARVDAQVTLGDADAAKATVDEVERRIAAHHLEGTAVHAHLLYFRSSLNTAPDSDIERARLLTQAIAILNRLQVKDDPLYVIMQNDIATSFANQGRIEESRTHFQEAIRAATALPTDQRDDGILGALYGNLASLDLWLGDVEGAESAFSHAQTLIDNTYGETYPDGWTAQALYAEFVHRRGDRVRALEMFAGVLKRIEGASHDVERVAGVRQRYANCLLAEGRPADAIPLLQAVVPVLRDVTRSEHRLTAVQMLLGQAYGASGRLPEAHAILKLAYDKGPQGSHDLEAWMTVRRRWAQQLVREDQPAAARAELETLLREASGPDVPIVALAQADLARLALARGDVAAARDLSAKSMATLSRVRAFHDVRIEPELWRVQAQVLAHSGDAKAAAQWCARALAASRKYDDPQSAAVRMPCPA